MTGAELVIKMLLLHGVDTVFGYPGGAAMPLYDALRKYRKQIRHIRSAHEQGAAHAADGYARASGRVGVCIATSGPGATNLISGIATAYMDSSPVVFLTANVSTEEIGSDSFQEADITGVTLPICKYNWIVKQPEKLAETLNKAFLVASSGRKGPVVVDLPKDVLEHYFKKTTQLDIPLSEDRAESRTVCDGDVSEGELINAAEVINRSKKPFVIIGGGVRISGASENCTRLIEKLCCPCGNTLMAAGEISSSHKLHTGMVGQYGNESAIEAIKESDLVIAIGMRFSNRTYEAIGKEKAVLHIDADRAEVNKNVLAKGYLVGDADCVLNLLLPLVEKRDRPWFGYNKKTGRMIQGEPCNCKMSPSEMFTELSKAVGDDCFVVTDVGLHQMWTATSYPFEKPNRFITSGGFGTMGFGLGAAVGVKVACEDKPVVLITGDGSFKMNCIELAMLQENHLPVLIVVMNNAELGMVRNMQRQSYNRRYIATEGRRAMPDFRLIGKAYGVESHTVKNIADFKRLVKDFSLKQRAMLLDCRI